MAVVAFASVKASPGATTATLAIAHVWPKERSVVVAECDPAGGDLALRLGLDGHRGLLSVAADAPGGVPDVTGLQRHLQPASSIRPLGHAEARGRRSRKAAPDGAGQSGLLVFAGHRASASSRNPLHFLGPRLFDAFAALDGDVLVDCGRLYPESPARPLAVRADRLVIVARPTPDELPRLAEDLPTLVDREPLLLLVGAPSKRALRYSAAEAEAALGLRVIGTLDDDPDGAAVLCGRPVRVTDLDAEPIVVSARGVASRLVAELSGADNRSDARR